MRSGPSTLMTKSRAIILHLKYKVEAVCVIQRGRLVIVEAPQSEKLWFE